MFLIDNRITIGDGLGLLGFVSTAVRSVVHEQMNTIGMIAETLDFRSCIGDQCSPGHVDENDVIGFPDVKEFLYLVQVKVSSDPCPFLVIRIKEGAFKRSN